MWLWRRRRQRLPPPALLPSLDRLADLIDRVVALLDEVTLAPEPPPRAEIVSPQHEREPSADGWVAFAHSPDGYRLLPLEGSPPSRNATVELEGGHFVVLRLGPSPLPGDRRRCAFLESREAAPSGIFARSESASADSDPAQGDRQEPSGSERTFDR